MRAYLVSEEGGINQSIREILIEGGVDCPASSTIRFDHAAKRLASEPAELIVAVLPVEPSRSIEALDILSSIHHTKDTLVVAVGPSADTKLVIRALRGVVDDYVDRNELEIELSEVLNRWRQRRAAGQPKAPLIAVLGPSGGAGSSTIAVNLAASLAEEHRTAALIDLKLETGDLASLLDLKATHSLADLCRNLDRLDRVFFERSLVAHSSGVHLLTPPSLLAEVDAVTPEGVRQAIGLAQGLFPHVIVDRDHCFREEQMQALRQADVVLLVLRLDFTSLRNTSRFMDHLDGLGISKSLIRLVVNRSGQPREVPLAKAEEALMSKVFHVIPDDPKAVNRATNHGVPVILDDPKSRVSRSLAKLAQLVQSPRQAAFPASPPPPTGKSGPFFRASTAPRRIASGRL